jgi:Sel1 repeat
MFMAKISATTKFASLAKMCKHRIYRFFLLKRFKASFFESFRADQQKTLDILATTLFSSKNPAWSMQLLELLASVPNECLEANPVIAMCFKASPEDKEPVIDYVLKAQSVLMSCFAIRSLEIKKSLLDYSDTISFKSTDKRPIAMNDLLIQREKILREWFVEHKLSAKMVKEDKGNFYNLAKAGAESGDSKSQYVLGLIYADGYGGVQKDSEKALHWFKASAAQCFAHAQCTVGYMYCLGSGVNQNTKEGKIWLDAAARNGSKVATWAKLQDLNSTYPQ